MTQDKVQGCLFGLALGDALAAPTEFLSVAEILRRWPPHGPQELLGNPSRVTDDTQMTLAVGAALVAARAQGELSPAKLEPALRQHFVAWLRNPDNNRAPGMTCLQACQDLAAGKSWLAATVTGSKGCGANMRVAPVGLLDLPPRKRAAIAQFQAAFTHGHPTALAASDLTAFAIAELAAHSNPQTLVAQLRAYAEAQEAVYHADWLGDLWRVAGSAIPEAFITRGWTDCLRVLSKLEHALAQPDRDADPCLATGAGWVAEEAIATGLLCFLLFVDDPLKALQRAAVTSGDSDSIACLTGAFAGACYGLAAWPTDWLERIEYRNELLELASKLQ